jgi:hypothetical protein
MTYRAVTVGEDDVLTRVDRQTVVLVVDGGLIDCDTSGRANVKSVSVVAAVGDVSSAVVNLDRGDCQVLGAVDAEALDGRVLDIEAGDARINHIVSVEELGLGRVLALYLVRCELGKLTLVFPPLLPFPSHHLAPLPLRRLPELPVTVILVPLTETKGPAHSL